MSQFDPNSPNNYPPQGNPNSWPPPSNQPSSEGQSWSEGQSSGWSQDQGYGQGSVPPPPPPDQGYGNYSAPQGQPYGYGNYAPPPPQGQPYASGGYGQQQQYYAPQPQMYPAAVPMQCPYCHAYAPPRMVQKISTAGWVVFAVLLFFCFPLCWIGLLMKEDQRACNNCGVIWG